MKPKKIPMRMCLGCNEMKPKKELLRIVRHSDTEILPDATGKLSGRGAYICPNLECFRRAKKAHRLEKAFECKVSDEVYDALEAEVARRENEALECGKGG